MQIRITYCLECNYLPRATSLAAELKQRFGVDAELIVGHEGIFDVEVDGRKVFSKFDVKRFPNPGEVEEGIAASR